MRTPLISAVGNNDIEQGRLLEEIHQFLDNSLATQLNATLFASIRANITFLEEGLRDDLETNRMEPYHIISVKNELLGMLQLTVNRIVDTEGEANQDVMESDFARNRRHFLLHVAMQKNLWERCWHYFSKMETNPRCAMLLKIFTVLYGIMALVGIASMIALIATATKKDGNVKWREDIVLVFAATMMPAMMIAIVALSPVLFFHYCKPCIDCYIANRPQNPRIAQGKIISNSIHGLFEQYKPYTLADFNRDSNHKPKNLREIGIKLYYLYVSTAEPLSAEVIRSVLEEYSTQLALTNEQLEQKINADFIHQLLNFRVDTRNILLRTYIASDSEITQEETIKNAVVLMQQSRQMLISVGSTLK